MVEVAARSLNVGWSWLSEHEARSAAGAGAQVAAAAAAAAGKFSCSPGWLAYRAPWRQGAAVEVRAAEVEAQLLRGVQTL